MTHYHKLSGWAVQQNAEPTTVEDVKAKMHEISSGGICTTGAGQEYMDPILVEAGWKHVFTYINTGHAQTPIKVWMYAKSGGQVPAETEDK
jgi:hypothetical protein